LIGRRCFLDFLGPGVFTRLPACAKLPVGARARLLLTGAAEYGNPAVQRVLEPA